MKDNLDTRLYNEFGFNFKEKPFIKNLKHINKRAKLNYFSFHISNPLIKILRNNILKILIKNKNFIKSYLGKIYKY